MDDVQRFLQGFSSDFGGIHIDPEELSEFVEDHGQGSELRKAHLCPCLRPETRQPRGNCPSCRGLRWMHPEGADYRLPVIAFVLSQQLQRDMRQAGELLTGTVQVTFPIGIFPGEGDLLLPDQEEHVVHQNLIRADQPSNLRPLRARATTPDTAPPKLAPFRERLMYPDVIAVERIWYWDEDAGRSVEAAPGHDYKDAFPGGEVQWHKGRGPTAGNAYSVRYRAPAAYMLFPGEPVFRSENSRGFPYKAVAQRLDRWAASQSMDYDRHR